jgi:hypothetical protein
MMGTGDSAQGSKELNHKQEELLTINLMNQPMLRHAVV